MRLYIIGPMRGVPYYNFPAFDACAARLRADGHDVTSPADLDRAVGFDAMKLPPDTDWNGTPDWFDLDACIRRDLDAVLACDAVVAMPGWELSTGAVAEACVAAWAGKRVFLEREVHHASK